MTTDSDTPWLTDQEQRAWRTHLDVSRLLMHQLEKDLQPFGLTNNDYEILVNLSEAEGQRLRMSDLAEATRQSKSRLSHQITRMEKAGHVRREHCESDRRGLTGTAQSRSRPCRGRATLVPMSEPPTADPQTVDVRDDAEANRYEARV